LERSSVRCIPSREPPDSWGSSGWKRWPTPEKNCWVNCGEGKLTANRPIITGLLHLLDGLRSILKTIEADSNEGEARIPA